jgi:hypothetical protein
MLSCAFCAAALMLGLLIPKLWSSFCFLSRSSFVGVFFLGLFLIALGLFFGETFFFGEADLLGPALFPEAGFF